MKQHNQKTKFLVLMCLSVAILAAFTADRSNA
jgi:hypothetical protein